MNKRTRLRRELGQELMKWDEKYSVAEKDYADDKRQIQWREERLNGTHKVTKPGSEAPANKQAGHVRNLCFEMVESQVDSSIPQPKVTAVREEDQKLAKIIEDLLRNLLDRLPIERINDEGERICPTQGGYGLLVEWLMDAAGENWMGDLRLTLLHPVRILPQPGVTELADMDYFFIDGTVTKDAIKRRFGVDLTDEPEEKPEARKPSAADHAAEDVVTLKTAFFKNAEGGIGRFYWVNEDPLEYMEDYQVRRVQRCARCGTVGDGTLCQVCGGRKFVEEEEKFETLTRDLETANGKVIEAMSPARDERGQIRYQTIGEPMMQEPLTGQSPLMPQMEPAALPAAVFETREEVIMEPTRLPYYNPHIYPVVVRKNVSKSGCFLGGSDVDALEDVQNALNKISTKLNEKVLGGGSFTTTKRGMGHFVTDGDNKVLEVEGPADLECVKTYNTQVDVSQDLALRQQLYEEGRQTIGVTDSMQGRRDPTATSRVAKEFSAQQAAGRLESKRVMKQAVFADLFELLFKFMLAFADEARPVLAYNEHGQKVYETFDRHDFLYRDAAGQWHYNTDFLFSCDTAAPLASNRQALWQETRMNFESGALGNPAEIGTLIRFWSTMEKLHYPLAGEVLQSLRQDQDRMAQAAAVQSGAGVLPGMAAQPAQGMAGMWNAPQYLGARMEAPQ